MENTFWVRIQHLVIFLKTGSPRVSDELRRTWSKPLGTWCKNITIMDTFSFILHLNCVVVLLSQSVLKVPKFCISSLNKQSVLWSWRHQSVSCLRDSDGENQQSFVWKFSKQPSGARNSCGIGGRGNLILRENYS